MKRQLPTNEDSVGLSLSFSLCMYVSLFLSPSLSFCLSLSICVSLSHQYKMLINQSIHQGSQVSGSDIPVHKMSSYHHSVHQQDSFSSTSGRVQMFIFQFFDKIITISIQMLIFPLFKHSIIIILDIVSQQVLIFFYILKQ